MQTELNDVMPFASQRVVERGQFSITNDHNGFFGLNWSNYVMDLRAISPVQQSMSRLENIARGANLMGWGAEYIEALLLAFGVALTMASRKLRFARANQFGVEQFRSYWDKLGTQTIEGLLRYLSLVLLSGVFVILGFRYEYSWGWIVTLPVSAFMLFLLFGS